MPNLSFTDIEAALLATIRADSDLRLVANGGYSRTIEGYEGQFETEIMAEILVLFPCVLAVVTQCEFVHETSRQLLGEPLSITVLLGDQNLRGHDKAKIGTAGSIGVYRMIDDLLDLLTHHRLGLDESLFDPLLPRRVAAVVHRKDLSVYAVEFEGSYLRDF